jgi:hypothetical protein
MKSVKIYAIGIISLLTGVLVISCTKTFDEKTIQQTNFNASSVAQIFVATVGASRNYVYVDAKPVTGALMTSGSLFPSAGYGFSLDPGIKNFVVRDTLSTTTQVPISFAENMQAGKHHTVFMYDTITSPKQKTVVDNIVVPADTSIRLRFANFIYNPNTPVPVDVYSFNRATNLFTNVPVTGVTEFIPYPSMLAVDTFYIRETGTLNQLYKLTILGGYTPKRNYTFIYRGSDRGTRTSTIFANY